MTTYRDKVWEDFKVEVDPLEEEEEVVDRLQEEDVATVGLNQILAKARLKSTIVDRLQFQWLSVGLYVNWLQSVGHII